MKVWSTLIHAICPITNDITTFAGQNIKAPTKQLAHEYCQNNGFGYLHISDELVAEIPCDSIGKPNFEGKQDYEITQNN